MQDPKLLEKKVDELEFINDQLTAELDYLDVLLRGIGFEDGLQSLKEAALEVENDLMEDESY